MKILVDVPQELLTLDPDMLVGTRTAAMMMGVTERAVRGTIERGNLPAFRIDEKWIINKQAIAFYMFKRELKKKNKRIRK